MDTATSPQKHARGPKQNGAQSAYARHFRTTGNPPRRNTCFEEGCPGDRLTLNEKPHQQAQARLSTGAGGLAGVAVGRSEEDVRIHGGSKGWNIFTRDSDRHPRLFGRPRVKEGYLSQEASTGWEGACGSSARHARYEGSHKKRWPASALKVG